MYWIIGRVGGVLAHGPEDLGSIPGRVIPKTLKIVLDTSLLNTQQYKLRVEGKKYRPPLHFGVVAIEKGAFWSSLTTVANFTFTYLYIYIYIYIYVCVCVCVCVCMYVCMCVCVCAKIRYVYFYVRECV